MSLLLNFRRRSTLHEDTSLAPEDKKAKMKELHESSMEKINAVLHLTNSPNGSR
jgi:hypothetical protein